MSTKFNSFLSTLGGFQQPPTGPLTPQQQMQQRSARNRGLSEVLYTLSDVIGDIRGQDIDFQQRSLGRQRLREQQEEEQRRKSALQNLITTNPEMAQIAQFVESGLPASLYPQTKTDDAPTSYREYALTDDTPTSGEYLQFLQDKQSRSGTSITFDQKQESEFQKEATKSAFKTLENTQKQVNDFVDIEGRLGVLQKQLEGGQLETGLFEEMKMPFQRLLAGLNVLSDDELKNLSNKELFTRTVNYIVPRMRVAGSGSTSDTEVQLFRESAPSLQLEEGGNLLIVGGMSAVAKHNRERLKLMEKYIEDPNLGGGDLVGFGEYADKTLGPVFKTYNSDESFEEQVRSGKLKSGDFVFDAIYGEFRILTDEDIKQGK